MGVNFGLSFNFSNPAEFRRPWDEHYQMLIDHVVEAEQLGFEHVWISEHHLDPDGYTPAPVTLMTAIAARTSRIRVSTNILILPFYNPLRLAEELATLDVLSGGRVMVGIGMGYRDEEFEAFGIPRKERVGRTVEGIKVMQAAWGDGPATVEGRHFGLRAADVYPKPLQPGGPPLFLGAASEPAARRVAQLGLNILPQGDRKAAYDPWVDELGKLGRSPDSYRIALGRSCFVTTSDNDPLWDEVVNYERADTAKYRMWNPGMTKSGKMTDQPEMIPMQWAVGSPERIIEKLELMLEMVPATEVIMHGCPPGMDPKRFYPRLEMFAKSVMPHFA